MNHIITIGDVLMIGGIGLGIVAVLGIAFLILSIMGSGWNH